MVSPLLHLQTIMGLFPLIALFYASIPNLGNQGPHY